ncbi:hypothetical protein SGLAM104S_06410 [Streptomyces glaucescens]
MPPAPCTTGSTITAASSWACSAISARRWSAYVSWSPAGGGSANTWRGSTPLHSWCIPPWGSQTAIGCQVSPVVAAPPGHHPALLGTAQRTPVLQAHLDGDLDRHRTGVGEEHMLESLG